MHRRPPHCHHHHHRRGYSGRLLLAAITLWALATLPAAADIFELCADRVQRTFIASNTSCRHYIYCGGEESYEGECSDGDYFNEEFQTCDQSLHNMDCMRAYEAAKIPQAIIDQSPAAASAAGSMFGGGSGSGALAELITTMTPGGGVQWENQPFGGDFTQVAPGDAEAATTAGVSTTTATPTTTTSISTTTKAETTTTTTTTTTSTSETPPPATSTLPAAVRPSITQLKANGCPVVDDPQQMVFLKHPTSCTDYFLCYRGEPVALRCSPTLHFNMQLGKCDYPVNARCRVDHTPARQQCRSHVIDFFPNPANCNYYYYCKNGYLLLKQCPRFFGWDYEKRACVAIGQARCYSSRNMPRL